jgi:hypothetical protein
MPEYRVKWEIDIEADDHTEAALQALKIQRDNRSTATIFTVTDQSNGSIEEVDLGHTH